MVKGAKIMKEELLRFLKGAFFIGTAALLFVLGVLPYIMVAALIILVTYLAGYIIEDMLKLHKRNKEQ